MRKVRLGRTNLEISKTSFGALPIQRVDFDTAKKILVKAYENGINFFDTAQAYSDSEEKIGYALADKRKDIIIATKTGARTKREAQKHLETSLKRMKTDYIDIVQIHNPKEYPNPEDENSPYNALVEAKKRGDIRFIGFTNHSIDLAIKAAESGLYDTVQFPISMISTLKDLSLIDICAKNDVGIIAMKALCGGLIKNIKAAFAFFEQYENLVPIWGIQKEEELDEFLEYEKNPPVVDDNMRAVMKKEQEELAGDFCRGCGYCLPCPARIPIPTAARMKFLLRRAVKEDFLTEEWQEQMSRIDNCLHCNRCSIRCPYNLDTPALLKKMYEDYKTFL